MTTPDQRKLAALVRQFRRQLTLYQRGRVTEDAVIRAAGKLDHWRRCVEPWCRQHDHEGWV